MCARSPARLSACARIQKEPLHTRVYAVCDLRVDSPLTVLFLLLFFFSFHVLLLDKKKRTRGSSVPGVKVNPLLFLFHLHEVDLI